jgi:tetratricopeptide (TPR) repeat protein
VKAVQGRKAAAWRLALERASGDLDAARADAQLADEPRIGAAMAALTGDPLPWLQNEGVDPESGEDSVADVYSRMAVKHWLGQKIGGPDLEWLVKNLSARSSRRRDAALNALFLLGEVEDAEPAFVEANPLDAFQYFVALERIPEALKALGLDPDHPDDKAWIAKRLDAIETDDIEDQESPPTSSGELVALATFLERRGLHQQAFDVFSPALTDFAAKDETRFSRFLGELYGNMTALEGAPMLATRIGINWAGEDDRRWDDLIIAAFGDDELLNHWWDWLASLDPKASRAERFQGMLALYGIGPDSTGLREHWLDLAWKAVEAAPGADRDFLLERISGLVVQSGDVANSMRAWEQMSPEARKSVFWAQHVIHLSALERWDDAAAVFLEQIDARGTGEEEPGVNFHAYAAAALRRAGHEKDAAVHDAWADKLALGNPTISISIGNGYAYGGDYRRAAEWWGRAAREADPDSGEFAVAAKLHADALLEEGKWRESAAISEVLARIYAGSNFSWTNLSRNLPLPPLFIRQRLQADTARALANLSTDREGSIALLEKCHHDFASDGSLADFFFPALRKVGLMEENKRWFRETWDIMEKAIRKYPDSDNTRNLAAWFASRARLKLDVAEKYLTEALVAHPRQAAYLDTMAEIQFARGNRKKALEWSNLAINFAPVDSQLRRQHERFRSDPLPD